MIKKELTLLTSIRFIAAFYILLFHLVIRWNIASMPKFFSNVLSMGPVAMSLFFLLSGFILTYNYHDKNTHIHYKVFLKKRFARIYPLYALAALLTLPVVFHQLSLGQIQHTELEKYASFLLSYAPVHFITTIILFVKSCFLFFANLLVLQAWFPGMFSYWNDSGSWSLSVEFFCYFLFPFAIYFLQKFNRRYLGLIMLIMYVLTIMPGIAMTLFYTKSDFTIYYAMPIFRLPEFLIGVIMGLFFVRDEKPCFLFNKKPVLQFFLISILWGIYAGFLGYKIPGYITSNFLIIPVVAIWIWSFAKIDNKWFYMLLGNRFIILLGESSYALYLLQAVPIFFFIGFSGKISHFIPIFANHYFIWIAIITSSIALATFFHLYFEKPMKRLILKNKKVVFESSEDSAYKQLA